MNYPAPLQIGDTVGLIAPCSPVTPEKLEKSIAALKNFGYNVCVGKSCYKSIYGYLSESDDVRAEDINIMFSNPEIKAIFCLRGGYGSTRIMKLINYPLVKCNPKIFVGYSDVTSFQLAFQSLCHLVTFYGPMVASNMLENFNRYSFDSLFHALSMPDCYHFSNPLEHPFRVICPGCSQGRLTGGCLSLVTASIGTFYQPDFHDTILLLEDIGETVPRCDRMLCHLKNAGIFEQVNGVLLGNFVESNNPYEVGYQIQDLICDFFKDYKKPVLYGVQCDHAKPMGTLPLGSLCRIDTASERICCYYQ